MAIRNKTCIDLLRFKKNNTLIFWLVTFYLIFLIIYFLIFLIFYADHNKAMALNEVGDFLAGAFSPIAFLFLYLGYRQNSEALSLQAKELRQSTEALQLQVSEMKESVEQQKIMGQLQRIELEERHISVNPIFTVSGAIEVQHRYMNSEIEVDYNFKFIVINPSENDARNLKIILGVKSDFNYEIIPKNTTRQFNSKLTSEEIENYKNKERIDRLIEIEFENIYGRRFINSFSFQCIFEGSSPQSYTQNLGTIMLVSSGNPN